MKVDKKTLDDISQWFKASEFSSATIEIFANGDFKISIKKDNVMNVPVEKGFQSHSVPPVAVATKQGVDAVSSIESADSHDIQKLTAPIVGVFYRAPGPDTPPFVQEGDKVKKGDVLCVLEAMKVMNEFEADFDMEIMSVLVENSELVEYGQALFEVTPL